MSWEGGDLQQASFRGLTFATVGVEDDLERRMVAHEYPYTDGAELDDLGRAARPTRITAVFHGPDYLTELNGLLELIDDGQSGEFVHPLLGSWTARIERAAINHVHSRRNVAEVTLDLREDGTSTELPVLLSVGALEAQVQVDVAAAQVEADKVAAPTEVATAISDASSFVDDLQAIVDDATARMDQLSATVDAAIESARKLGDVDSYPLVRSLRQMAYSANRLKQQAERLQPKVIEREIPAHVPLRAIANKLYGDPSRDADLLRINRVRNPFLIQPGTPLKVFSA